jgi:hypothetical protein
MGIGGLRESTCEENIEMVHGRAVRKESIGIVRSSNKKVSTDIKFYKQ